MRMDAKGGMDGCVEVRMETGFSTIFLLSSPVTQPGPADTSVADRCGHPAMETNRTHRITSLRGRFRLTADDSSERQRMVPRLLRRRKGRTELHPQNEAYNPYRGLNAYSGAEEFTEWAAFVLVDALGAAFVLIHEAGVIDTEEMQDGGVEIVDMEAVLYRIQTELIRGAVGAAALHTAAGHPHGEAGGVVIASIAFFAHGGPAEFAAPDDEGFVQQAA